MVRRVTDSLPCRTILARSVRLAPAKVQPLFSVLNAISPHAKEPPALLPGALRRQASKGSGRLLVILRIGEIAAVGVHHLGPGLHEVAHELFLVPALGIDFGRGAKLRIGAEDQVGAGRLPLLLPPAAVVADELLIP